MKFALTRVKVLSHEQQARLFPAERSCRDHRVALRVKASGRRSPNSCAVA